MGDRLPQICGSETVSMSVLQCGNCKERRAKMCYAGDRDAIHYVHFQIKALRTRAAEHFHITQPMYTERKVRSMKDRARGEREL